MINFEATLKAFSERGVNFVVIGGYAATLHGSAYLTRDLDICYERGIFHQENHPLASLEERSFRKSKTAPRLRGIFSPLEVRNIFCLCRSKSGNKIRITLR